MIKILHSADWHYSRKKAADVFASMETIEQHAADVDLQIIAGDIWDSPVQNTGASQFPEFIARVSSMAKKSPIVMVQGTPSHDSDGSLDIFDQDENITVLRPGKAYFLNQSSANLKNSVDDYDGPRCKALIFGVPEPQKKWLIASGTDITMDQALNALFLGYAAIRQQYPDLPCILVYHGQVRGARMGKGQVAEHGVSIDDLALVGADYIAMGDIHLPQRVGESRGLQAYYPGAIHPTGDWKDSDYQFGFNRVEIKTVTGDTFMGEPGVMDFGVTVSRIDLPHPVLTKIEGKLGDTLDTADVKGKQVWLEISGTKQDQAITNLSAYTRDLENLGAAIGSKVTFKTQATETVRAGAIAAMRKLRDKFNLWAENSGKTLTDTQLEKADLVEQDASGKGLVLNGGHFTFDRLELHGSKGIYKNQRKDHITLDLTVLDSGIVGLIGENGKGKTTIMNNFHPWPEMPNFGSDPLYKHFRLKDSLREFYATETTTGIKYKAQIKINAPGKTCEYFLFQGDGQTWEPVPGIDGRLKSYEAEVNRIFGTLEMYLRTAFMMQFPTSDHPDLSRATKGTKKAIMSALAGLDYFEVYKAGAKAKADTMEADIKTKTGKLEVLKESLGDRQALGAALMAAEQHVEAIKSQLPSKLNAGKSLAEEVKTLEQLAASQKVIEDQMIEATNRIPRDLVAKESTERNITALQGLIAGRPAAEVIVKHHADLSAREVELNAQKTKVLEDNAAIMGKYQLAKDGHDNQVRALEQQIRDIESRGQTETTKLTNQLVSVDGSIKRMREDLAKPITDHCPACRQMLPADALDHVKKTRSEMEIALAAIVQSSEALSKEITTKVNQTTEEALPIKQQLADIVAPVVPQVQTFDQTELNSIREQIQFIDIASARKTVEESASAQARIEEMTKQLGEIRIRIAENQKTAEELKAKLDPELAGLLSSKQAELTKARDEYNQMTNDLARADAEVEHARKALDKYAENSKVIDSLGAEINTAQAELADWNLLVQACGQNGIQALELDAVCPTIAAVANKLLEEYEDGRYSIRFDTTREGGKGNQIEDFLIMVIDSKDGGEQEFETLSGGECVWIRKALQDAFGIIRGQNSGVRYLTGFLDESDSALFPEARIAYFRMLESAHQQSVRRHTVMVSHSLEIQEMLSTKVEVTSL